MTQPAMDELDIPDAARWAVADAGLDGLRERTDARLARPEDFAARLWELEERWRVDEPGWRELCHDHGAMLGDRARFAELGALAESAGRAAAALPLTGSALAAWVLIQDPGALDAVRAGVPGALAWAGPDEPPAVRCQGGTLSGTVEFVLDGMAARVLVVVATDPAGAPLIGWVERPDGLDRRRRAVADPTRDVATVCLDGAPVTVLAEGERAAALLTELESVAAVLLALDALGAAQAALDLAVGYAKQRVQFGKVIGSYQAVAHHCSNMFVLVENARSLTRRAAWALAWSDPDAALAAAQAKAAATENAVEVGRLAIQVHGGIGMTWARPTHVHYKRAWVDRAALGSTRHHRERITAALAAAPARYQSPMYRTPF